MCFCGVFWFDFLLRFVRLLLGLLLWVGVCGFCLSGVCCDLIRVLIRIAVCLIDWYGSRVAVLWVLFRLRCLLGVWIIAYSYVWLFVRLLSGDLLGLFVLGVLPGLLAGVFVTIVICDCSFRLIFVVLGFGCGSGLLVGFEVVLLIVRGFYVFELRIDIYSGVSFGYYFGLLLDCLRVCGGLLWVTWVPVFVGLGAVV